MSKKTVFVCDDDMGIVDVVKIVLEEAGYNVVTTADSDRILQKVKKAKPDLVLIDLWMPGLGGEQIVPLLRKDPSTSEIPVIIVSASKDTKEVADRVNATGYLHKPFDIVDLEKLVMRILSPAHK